MAALGDRGGEHLAPVEPIADGIVPSLLIVACGEQHRLPAMTAQTPARDTTCREHGATQTEQGSTFHLSPRRER